jgi:hypothetical protein
MQLLKPLIETHELETAEQAKELQAKQIGQQQELK